MKFKMERASLTVFPIAMLIASVIPYDLKVLPEGSVISRAIGSNVLFTCQFDGSTDSHALSWFDNNGTEVKTRSGPLAIIAFEDNYKLRILNVEKYHEGLYTCKLSVNNVVMKEVSRELKIFEERSINENFTKQFLVIGTDSKIKCDPKYGAETKVNWRMNGQQIVIGEKYITFDRGLIVKMVTEADAGLYSCEMKQETFFLFHVLDIHVEVYATPTIVKGIKNEEGIEGIDFSFLCKGTGKPEPEYIFLLNNSVLANSDRINVDQKSGHLFFSPLKREDKGNITCIARNDAGAVNSSGYLAVKISPRITLFESLNVSEGQDVTLTCSVEGDPVPNISIKREMDGTVILGVETELSFDYTIDSVKPDDAGLYICVTESIIGNDNKDAYLYVKFKPRVVPGQRYNWTSYELQTLNITCSVRAYPPVTFEWYFNGKPIVEDATFKIFNSDYSSFLEMFISIPVQSWIYGFMSEPSSITCRASNSEGSIDINMKFGRSVVPNTLQNVSYEIHACQINFYVSMPLDDGGEPVTGVMVRLFFNETRQYPWGNTVEVVELKPETTYKIQLYGMNILGEGEDLFYELTTLPLGLPYPINIIPNNCSSDHDSILIVWEKPVDCPPMLGYKIRYRKVSVDANMSTLDPLEDWSIYLLQDGSALSANISNLYEDSFYEVEVYTQNSKGWSESCKGFVIKTKVSFLDCGMCGNSGLLKVIIIVSVIIILFLVVVDVSCYFTRHWGVLHSLMKMKENTSGNNRSFCTQDRLLIRSTFGMAMPSFKSQEEFVALTPTEDQSDNQRTVFSSGSQGFSSGTGSEVSLNAEDRGGDYVKNA